MKRVFLEDNIFDYSNITSAEKKAVGGFSYTNHYHHSKVRRDFLKKGYESSNMFISTYFGLTRIAKSWQLKLTPLEIQSAMWDFNGGLPLDPETGYTLQK